MKGTIELPQLRETRETGTRWLGTDGASGIVITFGSRQVNGGDCLPWRMVDPNPLLGRWYDGLLDVTGARQLGFNGKPRFLYLCSE